jgi:hypothetical protein
MNARTLGRIEAVVEHWKNTACPHAKYSVADGIIVIDIEDGISLAIDVAANCRIVYDLGTPRLENPTPNKLARLGGLTIQVSNLVTVIRSTYGSDASAMGQTTS